MEIPDLINITRQSVAVQREAGIEVGENTHGNKSVRFFLLGSRKKVIIFEYFFS